MSTTDEIELRPDPFGDWLKATGRDVPDERAKVFTCIDLEEAFDAGHDDGYYYAQDYFARGGTFR